MQYYLDKYKLWICLGLVAVGVLVFVVPRARAEGISKAGLVPIGEVAAAAGADWNGVYLGLHAGWANTDIDHPGARPYDLHDGNSGPPRQDIEGAIYGAHLGYNWQLSSNVVLGVEADFSWLNGVDGAVMNGNSEKDSQGVDWMASVRGRVGYAFSRFLPYLTAGVAWDQGAAGEACPTDVEYGHAGTAHSISQPITSTLASSGAVGSSTQ